MPQPPGQLPSALLATSRWERLGRARVPALLVHPRWTHAEPVPVVIWLHGRTARKELDPGRYLRLMRTGIGVCAVDLPGHGERLDPELQAAERTLDVVLQMLGEIDEVVEDLERLGVYDPRAIGLGGMSAGGMVALARLCRDHPFRCASVEASSGSWAHQLHRPMFRGRDGEVVRRVSPLSNLDGWREIPLQAIHAVGDAWVAFAGQAAFIEMLRERYVDKEQIDFVVYERTGAPQEHAGFGRMAADAKERQRAFFTRWLLARS